MTTSKTADVVIIGGGIIGVSMAYYLAQRNVGKIIVLERETLGSGSTGRSVASIDLFSLQQVLSCSCRMCPGTEPPIKSYS